MIKKLLKFVLRGVCRLAFRIEVTGSFPENPPSRLLIIANHQSFLDGLLLGLFLPLDPVFIVHTSVAKNRGFRLLLSLADYLALDTANPLAIKRVIKLIESGRPVVIFPEGRITVTGSLMKVYEGPAFIAARTGAAILPVRLDGAARSYFSRVSGDIPQQWFPRITLSFLPMTQLAMPQAASAKLRRQRAGEEMRKLMQNMLFASTPRRTLFDALVEAVQLHGRRTKVMEDMRQVEMNYAQILRTSLALGRMTKRLGAAGERLGVLLPNLGTTVCLLFGMSGVNRIPAMLNYTSGAQAMADACAAAQIQTIITSRKFIESAGLSELVAAISNLRWVYLEDLQVSFSLLDKLWLIAYAQWLPRWTQVRVAPQSPALVLFTSGSEGKPKGVVLSHAAILANVAQICAVIDFSPNDKFMSVLPIFHAFGLTAGAILPVVTGTKLFLYPTPLHYKVIPEIIYDRNCTVLFGTSSFLGHYAKHANPYDFYRMRYVVAGAEKLNDEVRRVWAEKFGIRILEGYGATECAPVLAVNTPMAHNPGSVGLLLPGIEHALEPVPGIDHGGILHVRGPNLMSGYFLHAQPGNLIPPTSCMGEGWYSTGDVVEVDAAGFVAIKGRVKRFAKIAGEMVSLERAEAIAIHAAPQHQHAVIALTDAQRGEALVLYTTDASMNRERLLAAARAIGSPELAVPKKIMMVDALPLLGTGKTDYVTLKTMATTA